MSVKKYKKICLINGKPDVTLIIGDTELPAHRSILSELSEYFKTMFSSSFMEASSDKITLKETDLNAFVFVLKYIYTGRFKHNSEKTTFEVLECARFYMVDGLSSKIISLLKSDPVDACLLLNNALAYHVDELIEYSTDLIRNGSDFVLWSFQKMSPQAMEHVLKICLNVSESTVFKALVAWMRNNPNYSSLFPNFLKYIDLYLLKEKHLDMLFKPIQLIDRTFVQNLLKEQQEKAQKFQKVVNQNVINDIDDLRIIEGDEGEFASGITYLSMSRKSKITVDLKHQYLLNCLKLRLRRTASYSISVSKDMHHWKCVIDHSKYECSGPQVLYFKECAFRFIRIQFIAELGLIDANIEALYSTDPFESDPDTTLTIPHENKVPTVMAFKCFPDTVSGYIEGYINNGCVRHKIDNRSSIIFQFAQPYVIGSMKLQFKFSLSSYYIEISTNNANWTRVFSDEDVIGLRTVTFPRQPVMFIKIVGTEAPSDYFELYELRCPAF